jgi:glycosyltransferase involved in cell wall biosynthesis
VKVEGEEFFSNWKGRNAGAAAAKGDVLIFCDADTILAENAIEWIDARLPPRTFGFFKRDATKGFNRAGERLALNQLKGFHVIPAPAFKRAQGYDELFHGYAAGADTDLEDRLIFIGLNKFELSPAIIESVIEHDNAARFAHHREPIAVSYGTGLLYRTAKFAALNIRRVPELPLDARRVIYATAEESARNLKAGSDKAGITVVIRDVKVGMPRQLGFESATVKLSLVVELSGDRIVNEESE